MTKRMDPEVKAMRAIDRALWDLPDDGRKRALEWVIARTLGFGYFRLPPLNKWRVWRRAA